MGAGVYADGDKVVQTVVAATDTGIETAVTPIPAPVPAPVVVVPVVIPEFKLFRKKGVFEARAFVPGETTKIQALPKGDVPAGMVLRRTDKPDLWFVEQKQFDSMYEAELGSASAGG